MIAKANPWKLKIKPKDGALHFDTNWNMLYVGEEDENGARWVAWGHVVPTEVPSWNRPRDPKITGKLPVGM